MTIQAAIRLALIAVVIVSSAFPVRSQEPNPRETFASAYALYTAGAYSQAKALFNQALEANYTLADYSLYHLAMIAFQEGEWEESRQLLSRLRQEYPRTIWYYPAELQQARIAIAEKNFPQAIEALRSLRANKNLQQDLSTEALYLQAQAQEAQGDVYQAYSLYQEVRSLAPVSRWAAAARSQVARFRDQYPEVFGIFTATAIFDEAERLVKERQFGQAEALYLRLLREDLGPELRLRLLSRLSNLYLSVRKRKEGIPLLEEIARDFPNSSEAPNALYRIGQVLWNRNENGEALHYFTRLMEKYPNAAQADRAQYAAADIYESQKKKDQAIALYVTLPKKFPHSRLRDDSIWRLAWLHYRAGEWQKAHDTFKSLAGQGREDRYQTAAAYWQARTAERLGQDDAAIRLYRGIIANAPESYYHALAARRLEGAGIAIAESSTETSPNSADSDSSVDTGTAFHLLRARELTELKLHPLAVSELDEIRRMGRLHAPLRFLLIREYAKNQAYSHAVRIANQLPVSSERDLYRFPLAYWDDVKQKAQERGIDPYLIVALIRQESLFDARARSPAAALGLMQLLPSTAGRVAKQLGLAVPSNERLFDPELNLTLGTQYLRDLMQRYSNNWLKAIAAYNAGEAAVDRWEQEIVTEDLEEFVERIPYLETRQYVKFVMRNHRIYKRLYDQQK